MTDLRTHWMRTVHEALCGLSAKRPAAHAAAILAALDAAEAQGYARAMGEVVALDERDPCPICNVADWARERLPAAAERD